MAKGFWRGQVIAIKTCNSSVKMAREQQACTVWNPEGISNSTFTHVLSSARIGDNPHRNWYDSVPGVGGLPGAQAGSARHITVESILQAVERSSYARAETATKIRALDGVYLVDILRQPFKSYQETGRSILRQLTGPSVFAALKSGQLVLPLGDHPKVHMETVWVMQGFEGKENPHHGPTHLGELLRAASQPCVRGSAPGREDLWVDFLTLSELGDDDSALELAGQLARRLAPKGPGPMHW